MLVLFIADQEYMKIPKLTGLIFCVLISCLFAPRARASLTVTTLGAFGNTNGANPYSPPTLLPDGTLYGVTPYGGATNVGVIYIQNRHQQPDGDRAFI